jgi:hypothetical protein
MRLISPQTFLYLLISIALKVSTFHLKSQFMIFRKLVARKSGQSTYPDVKYTMKKKSVSTKQPTEWELKARSLIAEKKWSEVEVLLKAMNSTLLPNGRNVAYVVSETCRRHRTSFMVTTLLQRIPKEILFFAEDDIMPMLSECADTGDMKNAQKLVMWMESINMSLSAKLYSVLLKGL